MPDNLDEPTHAAMRETAGQGPWAGKLAGAAGARVRIGSFDDHYRWLIGLCDRVDLWRTTYVHPLAGPGAIVEWLKATGLRVVIDGTCLGPTEMGTQVHTISLIGGLAALGIAGLHLSVSAAVGFIAVAGISVQNGVIMATQINELLQKGRSVADAILEGSTLRLRPIRA